MNDPKEFLLQLQKNLNTLREREAKYAGEAPLALLNQIDDHHAAIALTEQVIAGEIDEAEWQAALQPLLIAAAPLRAAQQIAALLTQYVPDQGEALAQQAGPQAQTVAGNLLTTTLNHLRQTPKGTVIADAFGDDPETYHKPVEKALAQAIVSDSDLAGRLKRLLIQYAAALQAGQSSGSQAALSGQGVITQDSDLSGGERSVVGSSAGGNIITGDENQVGGVRIGNVGEDISGQIAGRDVHVTGPQRQTIFDQRGQQVSTQHNVAGDLHQQGGETINMSGDFRGAILNLKSTLKDVSQQIGALSQAEPDERAELAQLVEQLEAALQKIPADHQAEAEAVADLTKDLVEAAGREKPNKVKLKISGDMLKQAAQNLVDVAPLVGEIAANIVGRILALGA